MRSLGTSDHREAESLARIQGVTLDEEFAKHRDTPARPTLPDPIQNKFLDVPHLLANNVAKKYRGSPGVMPIQEITRQDVVSFKNELLKSSQTPANINKQLIVLNTLLNYAKANALIDENHASGVIHKG